MSVVFYWKSLQIGYEGWEESGAEGRAAARSQFRDTIEATFTAAALERWTNRVTKAADLPDRTPSSLRDFVAQELQGGVRPQTAAPDVLLEEEVFGCTVDLATGVPTRPQGANPPPATDGDKPKGVKCVLIDGIWYDYIGFYLRDPAAPSSLWKPDDVHLAEVWLHFACE